MQNFKKLQVWEKSHDLTLKIYGVTSQFPREEIYGLTTKFVERVRRFRQTLPKVVEEQALLTSRVSFR